LICVATAEDVEDGLLSVAIEWLQNSQLLNVTGNEIFISPDNLNTDDVLTCRGATSDSDGLTGTAEASIVIKAKPIAIDSISIENTSGMENVFNDDSVVCSVTMTSPEDGPIFSYIWKHNDFSLIESSDRLELSGMTLFPQDKIICEVTV
jgi:hypothetical protein